MAAADVFNRDPAKLKIGPILARGSPDVTLYQADLQLGKHVIPVCLNFSARHAVLLVHFEQM